MSISLWLVPPEDHLFTKTYQELISDTVPSKFESTSPIPSFPPHVTLISGIDPAKSYAGSGKSAQEWLDGLQLPEPKKEDEEVHLELYQLEPGDEYFRKLVVMINKQGNLENLAAQCRQQIVLGSTENGDSESAAQSWAKKEYAPHMSLMYGEMSKEDVKKKAGLIELQLGFAFGSMFDCCGGTLCMGGSLVLVDTSKPIAEWKPIAQRETPWIMWKLSRSLA